MNFCKTHCRAISASNFILLLMVIALLFLLTACKKESEKLSLSETWNEIENLEEYTPLAPLPSSFHEQVVYTVDKIRWNGDVGIASVTITTPNLSKIIQDCIEQAIKESNEDDYEIILNHAKILIKNKLDSNQCPTIDQKVKLDAQKVESGYILVSNDEFERIIQGNIEDVFLTVLLDRK